MKSQLQKITAPIHRSTAYDFNVQLDHGALASRKGMRMYGSTTQDDEHLGVKEHEILVRRKYRDNVYGNGRLQVFSSLNNVMVSDELIKELRNIDPVRWANAKELIDKRLKGEATAWDKDKHSADLSMAMHKLYEYVGVAITPQDYVHKHSRQESQGFACTRGGLNTIINNGESKIQPGQKIYISFRGHNHLTDSPFENPSHHAAGIPHSKALVTLDNKDTSQEGLTDRVLRQMHEICRHDDNNPDKWYPLHDTTQKNTTRAMPKAEFCCKSTSTGFPTDTPLKLVVLLPNAKSNSYYVAGRTNSSVTFVQVNSTDELTAASPDPNADRTIVYYQNNISWTGTVFTNLKVLQKNGTEIPAQWESVMGLVNSNAQDSLGMTLLGPGRYSTGDDPAKDPLLGPNPAFGSSLAYMLQQVIEGKSVYDKAGDKSQFAHLLRRTVEVAIKAHEMQRRDPIGVAVSGARPGEPFDILLHG